MGVPITYRRTPERAVAFSFQDLTSGSAYQTFYGSDFVDGNVLSTQINYSIEGYTDNLGDPEFSTTFNIPLVVKGLAIVQIPVFWRCPTGTQNITVTIIPSIKKNTTTLVTGTSKNETKSVTAGTHQTEVWTWVLDTPETIFSLGDELVLSINVNVSQSSGAVLSGILHDAKDRDVQIIGSSFITSQLILNVPFRPDL